MTMSLCSLQSKNKFMTPFLKALGNTCSCYLAPGGTGKTFVTTGILAEIRRQSKIPIAVASSVIAATLLSGIKTAHTMFKILIDLDSAETPFCVVSRNSDKGHVFKDCSLIILHECTMANRKAVEAVDRPLQDIRRNEHLMGGVTLLFSGDFRPTLPVVTLGSEIDEVSDLLKRCSLLSRAINMKARLSDNTRAQEFSYVLQSLGEGTGNLVQLLFQLSYHIFVKYLKKS